MNVQALSPEMVKARPKSNEQFCPPNPNELETACRRVLRLAVPGV